LYAGILVRQPEWIHAKNKKHKNQKSKSYEENLFYFYFAIIKLITTKEKKDNKL